MIMKLIATTTCKGKSRMFFMSSLHSSLLLTFSATLQNHHAVLPKRGVLLSFRALEWGISTTWHLSTVPILFAAKQKGLLELCGFSLSLYSFPFLTLSSFPALPLFPHLFVPFLMYPEPLLFRVSLIKSWQH